jgi:hypothetical protein
LLPFYCQIETQAPYLNSFDTQEAHVALLCDEEKIYALTPDEASADTSLMLVGRVGTCSSYSHFPFTDTIGRRKEQYSYYHRWC